VQVQAAGRSFAPGSLLQARPNPFSDQVAMNYPVTAAGRVRIAVYNVAGQLVRMIADQRQIPGVYTTRWDGHDGSGRETPAGCYFVKVEINGTRHSENSEGTIDGMVDGTFMLCRAPRCARRGLAIVFGVFLAGSPMAFAGGGGPDKAGYRWLDSDPRRAGLPMDGDPSGRHLRRDGR